MKTTIKSLKNQLSQLNEKLMLKRNLCCQHFTITQKWDNWFMLELTGVFHNEKTIREFYSIEEISAELSHISDCIDVDMFFEYMMN